MLNFPSRRGTGSHSRGVQANAATFSEAISKGNSVPIQRCLVISSETLLGGSPCFWLHVSQMAPSPSREWSSLIGVCHSRMNPLSPRIYGLGGEGGAVSPGATSKGSFTVVSVGMSSLSDSALICTWGSQRYEQVQNSRFP